METTNGGIAAIQAAVKHTLECVSLTAKGYKPT